MTKRGRSVGVGVSIRQQGGRVRRWFWPGLCAGVSAPERHFAVMNVLVGTALVGLVVLSWRCWRCGSCRRCTTPMRRRSRCVTPNRRLSSK